MLALDPDRQPDATLEQARQAAAAGDAEGAARLAREALAERPLDGRPYEVLAALANERGDMEEAGRLAELAVKHAPREPLGRVLAAQAALQRGDWATAVRHYDRLLRVTPAMSGQVFPVLGGLGQDPASREALVANLADDPPWRGSFLRAFARNAPDPRPLFRELARKSELSPEEQSAYLGRYVADRRWGEAFAAWASLLPPESLTRLSTPMDGGFELPLTGGPPFSWEIRAPKGVEAALLQRPGEDGHALRVLFLGRRSAFNHVRQLLVLPPGDYVLAWRQRVEGLETERGLRWTMTCADGPKTRIIATEPAAGSSPWETRQRRRSRCPPTAPRSGWCWNWRRESPPKRWPLVRPGSTTCGCCPPRKVEETSRMRVAALTLGALITAMVAAPAVAAVGITASPVGRPRPTPRCWCSAARTSCPPCAR